MSMRVLGAALVLALVGVAGGFAGGRTLHDEPTTRHEAVPVRAQHPSIPVDPEVPYAPDIDYPALAAALPYRRHALGAPPYEWTYLAPRGWVSTLENLNEVRWRPSGEPVVGGYSLRVKLSTEHKSKAEMVTQKLAAMQAGYRDVEVLGQTDDLLSFSYRDPTRDVHRFNTFRWFSIPGESEARFEMSVVGREVDRAGLDDLLERVAAGVTKVQ